MKQTMRITKKLETLQESIGLHFKNVELLENAFVHRSYHNENRDFLLPSNEKLEFLGDSVLSLVTSVHLYTTYPEYKEGDYTDIKAAIVNTTSLYEAAKPLGLGDYLYLSKGEQENNGRENVSILADCFEALIGAIYLEHGFDTAYTFIKTFLFRDVLDTIVQKRLYLPAKNILQEHYQDKYKKLPTYKVLSESGPEHNKTYLVGVFDNEQKLGEGSGKSKKQGEEEAARSALQKLGI
ncbi:MAG: Ribonuclease 3 [Microgenomates bacterium OLB23]|nr:MAG: Ribonuclease 3 [Microgenomates bacterium OLB23]